MIRSWLRQRGFQAFSIDHLELKSSGGMGFILNYSIDIFKLILLPSTTAPALKKTNKPSKVRERTSITWNRVSQSKPTFPLCCNLCLQCQGVDGWPFCPSPLTEYQSIILHTHTAHCQSVWRSTKGKQTCLCQIISRWLAGGGVKLTSCAQTMEKQISTTLQW